MSTPAASAAPVAADVPSTDAAAATTAKPVGQISKEVTSEITADGMRIETNWDQVVTSFDDMNLKHELLHGIYAYGFEKPSAIQQRGSVRAHTRTREWWWR